MTTPFFLDTFLKEYGCDDELRLLIERIARAGKYVVHAVRHEHLGLVGTMNVQGEAQLKLDVLSDNIFCKHLDESNLVGSFASEEQEEAIELMGGMGQYSVAFDPLDGSSLVDANFSVGSIFGIFKGNSFVGKTGREMVAAGYILYGPRTTLHCSVGKGVHAFMLNDLGEFQCFQEDITVAPEGHIFAPGNLRAAKDRPEYENLVDFWMEQGLTLRYSGGMAADINMIFCKGQGIFCYPASHKYPAGKLRLLYECAPMAYLMEQSGGLAKNEVGENILDIPIEELHQRTPIFIGSEKTVEEALGKLKL